MDSLEIKVDRGGDFGLMTIDMSPGHLDNAPLPPAGSAAIWKYRAIYRQKDQRVAVERYVGSGGERGFIGVSRFTH